jgi:hypothetical protein
MHGGHSHGCGIHMRVGEHVGHAGECFRAERRCDGFSTSRIGVHYGSETRRSLLLQLVIDARVIAPEGAGPNHCHSNLVVIHVAILARVASPVSEERKYVK